MNYQPLGDMVLLLVPTVSPTTEAGVIKSEEVIAQERKSLSMFSEVIAVGEKVTTVAVGDKVLVKPDTMVLDFPLDGKTVSQVYEYNLMGKLTA